MTFINESDSPNDADYIFVTNVFLTPSCGDPNNAVCPAGSEDPNIFSTSAIGTGRAGDSCAGAVFNFTVTNVTTGEMSVVAQGTTLNGAITNVSTSLTLTSAAGFVNDNTTSYLIKIDSEIMRVTAGQGTTALTVVRGTNGTSAAAHANGAAITQLLTLGPADGSGSPFLCSIDFTGSVLKTVTKDSSGSGGKQTSSIARAQFTDTTTPFSNFGTSTTTVTGPILGIVKTPDAGVVSAGGTATFTVVISNTGDGAATNVLMNDPLPNIAGLTWTGPNPAVSGCSITGSNPQVLSCTTLNIPASGSATLIVSAVTSLQSCGDMPNTATITGTNGQQLNPQPADSGDITCQQTNADIFITKTDGVLSVNAGGNTTYTIRVTNSGPTSAAPFLIDPAASGMTKTQVVCSGTPGQCSSPPSIATLQAGFTLPTLTTGQFYELAVTVHVDAISGSITNTATVTPPNGVTNTGSSCTTQTAPNARTFDGQTGACAASDTDTVNPIVNLFLTKTDGVTQVTLNSNTTYTIRVTNNGPSTVAATLIDPAASGISKTNVVCSGTPGQCSSPPTIGQLEAGFTLPSLTSGQFYELLVTVHVDATSGTVTNAATVTPPGGTTNTGAGCTTTASPNPRSFNAQTGACTASDIDTIVLFTFSISKTPSVAQATFGQSIFFTMVIANNGPSSADGATVSDPAIGGFNATGVSCTGTTGGATCPSPATLAALQNGTATIATFPSGSTVTLQLDGTFQLTQGSATNTVTVCPAQGLNVNCAQASATVSVPSHEIPVPTLGEYALIALMLMMAGLGVVTVRRRRR